MEKEKLLIEGHGMEDEEDIIRRYGRGRATSPFFFLPLFPTNYSVYFRKVSFLFNFLGLGLYIFFNLP